MISAAVIGVPSENVASLRILKVTHERSSGYSMLSAMYKYELSGSSADGVNKLSDSNPRPVTRAPFRI